MIIILISLVFHAKTQVTPTGSLLWEISGKKLSKPSYIFGTIHIQDRRVFSFRPVVEEKLKLCEAFAMEMLLDEVAQDKLKKAILMVDTTLDQLLSNDDYEKLDSIFIQKTGISIHLFNSTKPFFISSELGDQFITKDMPDHLDIYLLKIARENGKKIIGIETFEEQVETVDKIPLKEQAEMLLKSADDTADLEIKYNELLKTYLDADLDKMIELSKDTALPLQFSKIFVEERNVRMANRIAKFIRKQSTFCAFGAAHFGGSNGVIALLRKKGYTVNPVY